MKRAPSLARAVLPAAVAAMLAIGPPRVSFAAAAGAAAGADAPDGAALYAWHCLPCHAAGAQYPGTLALQVKYQGSLPAVLTERRDLGADAVRIVLRQGINVMPYYRRTELSDAEVAAIAGFLARRD